MPRRAATSARSVRGRAGRSRCVAGRRRRRHGVVSAAAWRSLRPCAARRLGLPRRRRRRHADAPSRPRAVLPLPRRGETALARARALAASGHLHDALVDARARPADRPAERGCRPPARRHSASADRATSRRRAPRQHGPRAMKCPKCGYLGFEAVDRCRNCGYDFSLASPLDVPSCRSEARAECRPARRSRAARRPCARRRRSDRPLDARHRLRPVRRPVDADRRAAALRSADSPTTTPLITKASPPRPPLAVRRATPEVPRLRTGAARAGRRCSTSTTSRAARRRAARRRRRAGAGHDAGARPTTSRRDRSARASPSRRPIDLAHPRRHRRRRRLLHDADLRRRRSRSSRCCRRRRSLAFLLVQNGGYLVAFTAGGQTLGKMAAGIKVVPARSRRAARSRPAPLVAHAGLARCSPFPPVSGSSPRSFGRDHRGLHDRFAGTQGRPRIRMTVASLHATLALAHRHGARRRLRAARARHVRVGRRPAPLVRCCRHPLACRRSRSSSLFVGRLVERHRRRAALRHDRSRPGRDRRSDGHAHHAAS